MSKPNRTSSDPSAMLDGANALAPSVVEGVDASAVTGTAAQAAADSVATKRSGGLNSAYSASLLLMASSLVSGVFSLLRQTVVARYFGTGTETAAYSAAFQLPNMISYLLIGGAASSALISVLSRYREQGREHEADEALSNILNVMTAVLVVAVILGELFTPLYVRYALHGFRDQPEVFRLCVHLSRILLIGPVFFFAGGVLGSRLLVRRIFFYQALQPVIYSGSILLGAVTLHARFGINSLAYGAMAGAFLGFLVLPWFGARRTGLRWTPTWDLKHPALREWFLLNLPLMLGQSLTTTDEWIRNFYISSDTFDLSRLTFARQLFTAPMNVLGPAAGTASLPFFAALWHKRDIGAFSAAVDRGVSRMVGVSLLVAGWMIGLAPLLISLVLRGGRFTATDAAITTHFFAAYTLSLFLWTSQNLYARAFYAAGNTFTPMLSGTVVTLVSIPIYGGLFHALGAEGLVWAADVGMLLHTGSLAVLLHRKRMVSLAELEFGEIGRALLAALVGGLAAWLAAHYLPRPALAGTLAGSLAWLLVAFVVLKVTGSKLPDAILRRRKAAAA